MCKEVNLALSSRGQIRKAGEEAAKKVAEGKTSVEELKDEYATAKEAGFGEDFKKGYAKGAAEKTG